MPASRDSQHQVIFKWLRCSLEPAVFPQRRLWLFWGTLRVTLWSVLLPPLGALPRRCYLSPPLLPACCFPQLWGGPWGTALWWSPADLLLVWAALIANAKNEMQPLHFFFLSSPFQRSPTKQKVIFKCLIPVGASVAMLMFPTELRFWFFHQLYGIDRAATSL